MNAKQIADAASSCDSLVSGVNNFRSGGNMGMMFIAQAIETHAEAINRLAGAINISNSVTTKLEPVLSNAISGDAAAQVWIKLHDRVEALDHQLSADEERLYKVLTHRLAIDGMMAEVKL